MAFIHNTTNGRVSPNAVEDHNDFYISYNSVDRNIYGSDTTAIVISQGALFLILNGDHRDAMSGKNLNDCINYFVDNIDSASSFSEHKLLNGDVHKMLAASVNSAKGVLGDELVDLIVSVA